MEEKNQRTVFLAGPFMAVMDEETGVMSADKKEEVLTLIDRLEGVGFKVFNAHKRESWGAKMLPPEVCVTLDHDEIRAADLVIAIPGDPPSPGTHIELGWASAYKKPIIILAKKGDSHAFLVSGLHTITEVIWCEYKSISDIDVKKLTADFL